MKKRGFNKREKDRRIDTLPKSGTLTGRYEIDFYGCWWEMIRDKDKAAVWIIGEYPTD